MLLASLLVLVSVTDAEPRSHLQARTDFRETVMMPLALSENLEVPLLELDHEVGGSELDVNAQ